MNWWIIFSLGVAFAAGNIVGTFRDRTNRIVFCLLTGAVCAWLIR